MGSLRYLNTILTVLAILLSLQLWTTWTTASSDTTGIAALGPRTAWAGGDLRAHQRTARR